LLNSTWKSTQEEETKRFAGGPKMPYKEKDPNAKWVLKTKKKQKIKTLGLRSAPRKGGQTYWRGNSWGEEKEKRKG